MKKDIHPKYNNKSEVTCACGAIFPVGSTMNEIKVEIDRLVGHLHSEVHQ